MTGGSEAQARHARDAIQPRTSFGATVQVQWWVGAHCVAYLATPNRPPVLAATTKAAKLYRKTLKLQPTHAGVCVVIIRDILRPDESRFNDL